jgi:hypothetical protein
VQDSGEKLKQASERYLEIVRNQTEEHTGNTIGVIILKRSSTLDQLSVSALVVSGAVLTLCISNASDVLSVISSGGYAWMMALFMLSALSGFLAKVAYSIGNFHIAVHCEMFKALEEITDKFESETEETQQSAIEHGIPLNSFYPRAEKTKEALTKTFPPRWRPFLLKHLNSDSTDAGTSGLLVNAWKFVAYQFFGFMAQVLFFIVGFIIAVGGFAS